MKKNLSFRQMRFKKYGTLTFMGGIILLVLLTLVNFAAASLPAKVTKFDVAGTGLSELAEESEKFIGALDEDVTIYWFCKDDVVDTSIIGEWFELLLTRYEEASDHITVERVNTTETPEILELYAAEDYTNHSIVVASSRRSMAVDAAELFTYSSTFLNQYIYEAETELTMDQMTTMRDAVYAQYGIDIMQYSIYNHSSVANAQIIAAMDYVTRETVPHGYLLTGFGGEEPTEDLIEYLSILTETLGELDISTADAIPEDANCIILHAPQKDLTETQANLIKAYLNRGGSLMLTTSPDTVMNCPNLAGITAEFGLSAAEGMVTDISAGYYASGTSTDVLTPDVNSGHDLYSVLYNYKVKPRMPRAHAITIASSLPTGVNATSVYTTSAAATRVELGHVTNTLGKAEKMNVAVHAVKQVADINGVAKTAQLMWFGSTEAFNAETAKATENANYYYLVFAFATISPEFTSGYESIPGNRVTSQMLDAMSGVTTVVVIAILTVAIPLGLLATGIVIWVKRKRRH